MQHLPLLVCASLFLFHAADAACARGVYNSKICSGHGSCNPRNLCECDARHFGFDCSQSPCAVRWGRRGWLLRGRRTTRTTVECSNKGVCDYEEGACTCDEGFVGSACQRLEYPHACNGAGQCLSLKELSATYAVGSEPLYDNVWDAEMVYGCKCSKGYHDYDCSLRTFYRPQLV
uniref:EGF-like domain-containing protein n=1 Tax=Phytophthora fragariae TaxID=53985 RepID=A0A6A3DU10_9STRA|nr:hypothetical protein PF009_g26989 [Phytophthora fragariae]